MTRNLKQYEAAIKLRVLVYIMLHQVCMAN